ncbi:MAG: YeeE/YedE family protein [Pseudomonadota bacterium]
MDIIWIPSDILRALVGGLLIGGAAALLLLVNGRIMGASSLLGGLLDGTGDMRRERLAFLAGLIGTPLVLVALTAPPPTNIDTPWTTLIGAGLLVGIGTRLGAGCTSGHGVCGLSRVSPRSAAATATFITAGILTVRAFG